MVMLILPDEVSQCGNQAITINLTEKIRINDPQSTEL